MAFRFLHTADWQLGKPFGSFDSALVGRLRAARIDALLRMGRLAMAEEIGHVLVAGDVFDQETPSDATLRQALDTLAQSPGVTWWLLPGNHDPARRNGLWDRVVPTLPPNVRALTTPGAYPTDDGTFLLAAPWTSKAPGRDLTEDFDRLTTPPGACRIGIAHGSVTEFESDAAQSAAIAPDRARRAGLDYLALGDWHGFLEIGPRTFYPGTPEPDRFPKNNQGCVLSVAIRTHGTEPDVKHHDVATFHWEAATIVCADGPSPTTPIAEAFARASRKPNAMFHLFLTGHLRLPARADLIAFLERERAALAHLSWDDAGLHVLAEAADLDDIDREGALREAAQTLLHRAEDESATDAQCADARHALDLLAAFARRDHHAA